MSTELESTFATTFERFFRIKDLIDNINIKHFRSLQGRRTAEGAKPIIKALEDGEGDVDASGVDAVEATEEAILTEIDLTEEALSTDRVTKTVTAEASEPTSATEASFINATDGGTFEEEEDGTLGESRASGPGDTTTTEAFVQLETTTEEIDPDAAVDEDGGAGDEEEDESLNEIDTGGFVVSQDTLDSAKKYGYKILLKKVGI